MIDAQAAREKTMTRFLSSNQICFLRRIYGEIEIAAREGNTCVSAFAYSMTPELLEGIVEVLEFQGYKVRQFDDGIQVSW